ncbi:MAG: tRNA-binding protein [Flavobacteriales bacterium]|nr:tRNA-binding protein [Flavobacteriales bacterium]
MNVITWSDFERVEMRAGTIIHAEDFPEANKPAIKLTIDFGEQIGVRKSSAQITHLYSTQSLVGKQVIAVVNFPPKQIGPFTSECLMLGCVDDLGIVTLIQPMTMVRNGERVG